MPNPITNRFLGFLSKLSFPKLFVVSAAIFVLDLLVPDVLPFADEILLGLGTLLIASFRKRRDPKIVDTQQR